MVDTRTNDGDRCTRRTFLERGVAGSALALGLGRPGDGTAGFVQQDDGPIPRIRAVVPRLNILANEYLHRLVIFVGNYEREVPPDLARRCFGEDAPRRLDRHDAIVADWEGVTRLTAETAQEALERTVPTRAYLKPGTEVSVSAPYVIVGGHTCDGEYLNVGAHKLPEAVRGGVGSLSSE